MLRTAKLSIYATVVRRARSSTVDSHQSTEPVDGPGIHRRRRGRLIFAHGNPASSDGLSAYESYTGITCIDGWSFCCPPSRRAVSISAELLLRSTWTSDLLTLLPTKAVGRPAWATPVSPTRQPSAAGHFVQHTWIHVATPLHPVRVSISRTSRMYMILTTPRFHLQIEVLFHRRAISLTGCGPSGSRVSQCAIQRRSVLSALCR